MRYYLKERNGIWQICWTDQHGRPQRKSTRTADSGQAELELARHIIQNDRPRELRLESVTLDQILLRYWLEHGQSRFAADVIRRVMGIVAERLPCLSLSGFTMAEQEKLFEGFSPVTARRYLAVVRAAVRRAFRRGEIEREPPIMVVEAEDGPGARPYSLEELARLLAAAELEHERRLLLVLVATGCRPQAALQLTWGRVKDGVADFHVPGRRRTKKRRARAPLSSSVSSWLEQRRGLGPVVQWDDRGLAGHKMTFQRIAKRAGVDGTAYGIRKALATWLRSQDVPEWEVGALLGHRVSSSTTERYAHYRPGYMRATVAAVEALLAAIRPGWLDTAETPAIAAPGPSVRIRMVSNGLSGSRDWDRTSDHFHVKDAVGEQLQSLTPANDD